jgi:hypothetical protein
LVTRRERTVEPVLGREVVPLLQEAAREVRPLL